MLLFSTGYVPIMAFCSKEIYPMTDAMTRALNLDFWGLILRVRPR